MERDSCSLPHIWCFDLYFTLYSIQRYRHNLTSPINALISLLYGTPAHGYLKWNPPLWFFTSIFSLQLIFYFVNKISSKYQYFVLSLLFGLGIIFSIYTITLPWSITSSLMAIPYFFLGKYLNSINGLNFLKKISFWILIPAFVFYIVLIRVNTGVTNFALNTYGNIPISYLTGIIGIFLVMKVSLLINSKLIVEIGKNSLIIFSIHVFSNAIVSNLIIEKLSLNQDIIATIAACFSTLLIIIPIIILKRIPYSSIITKFFRIN